MIPTLFFVLASSVPGQSGPTPSATEAEVRALAERRRLARGEVRLTQLTFRGGGSKPDQKRISHIWFDGKQLRLVVIHYPKGQDPFRDINCKNCQFDGTFVTYSTAPVRQGPPVAISFSKLYPGRDLPSMPVIDPRTLGMKPVSSPNLATAGLDSILGRPDRKESRLEHVDWHGKRCELVTYRAGAGFEAKIWILPDEAYGVAKVEVTGGPPGGGLFVEQVESELVPVDASGIWFPRRCVYSCTVNGESREREEVDVEVLSLNRPLNANVFRLDGMELPVNTSAVGVPGYVGRPMLWDGQKLVEDPEYKKPPPVVVRGGKPVTRIIWLCSASALLALAAAYWIWKAFRPR